MQQQRINQKDEDDFVKIEVRRSFLFKDAMQESKKKKFIPENDQGNYGIVDMMNKVIITVLIVKFCKRRNY